MGSRARSTRASLRRVRARGADLRGDFQGERVCGPLTRLADRRPAGGARSDAPDRGADQRERGGEEDPGLERLQRPVVARRLVGDEHLQVMRERVQTGRRSCPSGPPGLWCAGWSSRKARRDRRAVADEQIVQLRGAERVVGASTSAAEIVQAFGIVGVLGDDADARRAPERSRRPSPAPREQDVAWLGSRCGRTQSVKAIRVATKPNSVAAIAGSVRRVSAPVATPSANAKPA